MSKITVTTIAGQTSGADANKVKIESGDTLQVETNATVGGTLAVTGGTTLSSTANVGNVLTLSGNDFANSISMANSGTGGTTFTIFSTSDAYAQPSANWMLHHSSSSNGIILADQNGRVRMPYQPAFSTYGTAGNVSFTGGQEPIITAWNTMIFNVGSHFNTSTGKFTAPIAGKYFFRAQLYMQNFTGVFRFRIYKNTSVAVYHYYPAAASPGPAFIAGFLNLAANDTVHLTGNADNTGNIYFADNHSNFDGYLVV